MYLSEAITDYAVGICMSIRARCSRVFTRPLTQPRRLRTVLGACVKSHSRCKTLYNPEISSFVKLAEQSEAVVQSQRSLGPNCPSATQMEAFIFQQPFLAL